MEPSLSFFKLEETVGEPVLLVLTKVFPSEFGIVPIVSFFCAQGRRVEADNDDATGDAAELGHDFVPVGGLRVSFDGLIAADIIE